MQTSRIVSILRAILIAVWVAVILFCLGAYLTNPAAFTAENIAFFLRGFHGEIWLVYLAMSALRGFTLLPSTPLVIAGTLLFPEQPILVLFVSLTGILLSSSMIYFFSDFLGFSAYFERHNADATYKLRARLEHPLGFLFVTAWAFFPFVPTDLVCYLAGTTKMSYWKFIASIFVGELVLCSMYVFFGGALLNYVR
ncbi:MAG: TVP38/TMEM64 family protein [Pyrinomonadaceae bacterium]